MDYHRAQIADTDTVYVIPIGDVHYGHPACDVKMLQGYLDWVAERPESARILLMGDLIESATRNSVGAGVYEQEINLDAQVDGIIALLKPYAGQIDAAVGGNHEQRIKNETGLDVTKLICRELGVRYLGYSGVVGYSANKISYSVYMWHGAGGGRKPGGALNRMEDMTNIAHADAYLMGHTHKLGYFGRDVYAPDARNNKMSLMRQVFVNTGSCLGWNGGYAEMAGLGIPKRGFARVRLNMEKGRRDIHVSI